MKHIPTWFPGAGFQRKAQEWNRQRVEMIEAPYRDAKARIVSPMTFLHVMCTQWHGHQADGTAGHSYVSYQLSTLNPSEDNTEHELLVKNTAASMFSGTSDYKGYRSKLLTYFWHHSWRGHGKIGHLVIFLTYLRATDCCCNFVICFGYAVVSGCTRQSSEGDRRGSWQRSPPEFH